MGGMHIRRAWTTRPRENKAKIGTRCKCSQDMNSRREYGSYPCNTAHSARTTAALSCAAEWRQLEQYIRKLAAIETQRAKNSVFSLMCRKEKKTHTPLPHPKPKEDSDQKALGRGVVNMINMHCMHVWKQHGEIHQYVQLIVLTATKQGNKKKTTKKQSCLTQA